jgi:hypothetical protein
MSSPVAVPWGLGEDGRHTSCRAVLMSWVWAAPLVIAGVSGCVLVTLAAAARAEATRLRVAKVELRDLRGEAVERGRTAIESPRGD